MTDMADISHTWK